MSGLNNTGFDFRFLCPETSLIATGFNTIRYYSTLGFGDRMDIHGIVIDGKARGQSPGVSKLPIAAPQIIQTFPESGTGNEARQRFRAIEGSTFNTINVRFPVLENQWITDPLAVDGIECKVRNGLETGSIIYSAFLEHTEADADGIFTFNINQTFPSFGLYITFERITIGT